MMLYFWMLFILNEAIYIKIIYSNIKLKVTVVTREEAKLKKAKNFMNIKLTSIQFQLSQFPY
jgi:hypothetical protein